VVYRALGRGTRLSFEDKSFADRIGWREVTIVGHDGGKVVSADVPTTSASDELRAYPSDLLRSPLSVTSADATVELGARPGTPPTIGAVGAPHTRGGFASLVAQGELSVGVLLLSLLIAAFWGAAHALTPGHGKAMVAAYLVGTKGTSRHAVLLGGTVTVAHTAGVFALGFVTLGLSAFIVPEQLYPWLTLVSGVLVVLVGASVLRQRLRSRPHASALHHHHDHDHDHHHDHHHAHEDALSSKGILGVGVAAGLLPCPSALVVLLSAIALHRIALGLALIVAFSLGLAATITGIGLVAVLARRTFGRLSLDGTVVRRLPAVSAAMILVVGLVITARALPGVI
jgi:ABC-type nickel/cobalt efflux system permease component RcnA